MTAEPDGRNPDPPRIGTLARRPGWVLFVLLVALGLNIGAAFLPAAPFVKTSFHLIVAAGTIAGIAFIFMELEKKGATIRLFAAAGFVWIAILMMLIFADYGLRPLG